VRPTPNAQVSAPLAWDEVGDCEPSDFTIETMVKRYGKIGDAHAAIDKRPCSLAKLVELSARHEREGLGDAPWPPQYRKGKGEPPRVQPSRRRATKPLIEIGRARKEADARAGFDRWKKRHAKAAKHLHPEDVLVDAMRGRYKTWWRIRVNLEHVPEDLRPKQEALDPDEEPDG